MRKLIFLVGLFLATCAAPAHANKETVLRFVCDGVNKAKYVAYNNDKFQVGVSTLPDGCSWLIAPESRAKILTVVEVLEIGGSEQAWVALVEYGGGKTGFSAGFLDLELS